MADTDEYGIQIDYLDNAEQPARVGADTVRRLRAAIGTPTDFARPLVVRPGAAVPAGVVGLEDGGRLTVRGRLSPDVPLGYHRLQPDDGPERRLIVSPGRCVAAPDRAWGWAVQLYAARSASSAGIGDLVDLRWLVQWSRRHGAGFALVNPLHASAPEQASPYYPSSRRFVDPVYLRVDGAAPDAEPTIDRPAIWAHKRTLLRAEFDAGVEPGFQRWRDTRPGLDEFAVWSALAEQYGADWRSWPDEYRSPDAGGIAAFARSHRDDVAFHAWLQWRCHRQLAEATADLPVIQDLPIGVDPGGVDAWCTQDVLAADVSVGAPPDPFNQAGQDWGLPPFVPWRLQRAGYQPFIDAIRATMATGGGLRIDHVMGLFRLWWIPAGSGARDGGYVRYPADDLLDIVALESHRAGALVVGEDLGTVEPGVRETLLERNILSYRLLWFEDEPPARWPRTSMAAVTTHDLPTVAGVWTGSDLDDQRASGVDADAAATEDLRARIGAAPGASAAQAVVAAYRALADAPSQLLVATLEDAMVDQRRPNIPGTTERDNWSRALPRPIESLESDPVADGIAAALSRLA